VAPRSSLVAVDTGQALAHAVVEIFNNEESAMAIVNFSVPDEVRHAFDKAFAGENKSAVIARLMRGAVEERRQRKRRAKAIDALLELRRTAKPVTRAGVRAARMSGRP
jgi:hypothetical protein